MLVLLPVQKMVTGIYSTRIYKINAMSDLLQVRNLVRPILAR
jgi:hypothetical protein